jgi:hypothetical protein
MDEAAGLSLDVVAYAAPQEILVFAASMTAKSDDGVDFHLRAVFAGMPALDITGDRVTA